MKHSRVESRQEWERFLGGKQKRSLVFIGLGCWWLGTVPGEWGTGIVRAREARAAEERRVDLELGAQTQQVPFGEQTSPEAGAVSTPSSTEVAKPAPEPGVLRWSGFVVKGDPEMDRLRAEAMRLELQLRVIRLRKELDDAQRKSKPVVEEAKPAKPPEPPPKVKVLGMDPTGTRLSIDGRPYAFGRVGETVRGVTLKRADSSGVTVLVNGREVDGE